MKWFFIFLLHVWKIENFSILNKSTRFPIHFVAFLITIFIHTSRFIKLSKNIRKVVVEDLISRSFQLFVFKVCTLYTLSYTCTVRATEDTFFYNYIEPFWSETVYVNGMWFVVLNVCIMFAVPLEVR